MQINIKNPCTIDRSELTAAGIHKYCSKCNSVIRDFSDKSDQEIINHLRNAKGRICGIYHESQLNRPLVYSYRYPVRLNRFWSFLIGLFSFTVSVQAQENKKEKDSSGKEWSAEKKASAVKVHPRKIKIVGEVSTPQGGVVQHMTIKIKNHFKRVKTDKHGRFSLAMNTSKLESDIIIECYGEGFKTTHVMVTKAEILRDLNSENEFYVPLETARIIYLEGIISYNTDREFD